MATRRIEFKINKQKVIEALVMLAARRPRIDIFHVCKVFFYADLDHLRRYGRPVLGDRYVAMDDGPVPSFTLSVVKHQMPFAGADWVQEFDRRIRVDDSDGYARLIAYTDVNKGLFSRTDFECLDRAIETYADMPFKRLWKRVHEEPAYKAAYREGTSTLIPVESLIPPEVPGRESIIEHLQETAHVTDI
jgi:hypothetical protein